MIWNSHLRDNEGVNRSSYFSGLDFRMPFFPSDVLYFFLFWKNMHKMHKPSSSSLNAPAPVNDPTRRQARHSEVWIEVSLANILVMTSEVGAIPTLSKIMHRMDAWALRKKDAFKGETPWGDTVCDPWISNRETVSKRGGALVCCALSWTFET